MELLLHISIIITPIAAERNKILQYSAFAQQLT